MQSTCIKHSQLLMGFMAAQQEKVSQGITASGFSKELECKQKKDDTALLQKSTELPGSFNETFDSLGSVGKEGLFQYPDYGKKVTSDSLKSSAVQKVSDLTLSAPSSAPLTLAQWDQSQKLTFTDPVILDKVMAQLNLPAGTRDAFNVAQNATGEISLREVTAILDQAKLPPDIFVSDEKIALPDVQALLASLRLGNDNALSQLKELNLKQKGYYSLSEFRGLLKTVAEETAKEKLKQDQQLPRRTQYPQVQNQAGIPGAQSSTSTEKHSYQTQNLAAEFVSSLPIEEDDKKRKAGHTAYSEISSDPEKNSYKNNDQVCANEQSDTIRINSNTATALGENASINDAGLAKVRLDVIFSTRSISLFA